MVKLKFKVKLQARTADVTGRKPTAVTFVRTENNIEAAIEALRQYPGYQILEVDEV